jgi:hypothetical protein
LETVVQYFHAKAGLADVSTLWVIAIVGPPSNSAERIGRECVLDVELSGRSGKVQFQVVDVAPAPSLAGLERLHDRVLSAVEVLGGVFVFRRVAATDMAALQAQPQVHPAVTHLQTLFAALCVWRDLLDLVEMLAGLHGYPLQEHGPGKRNREPYENIANLSFDDTCLLEAISAEPATIALKSAQFAQFH